MLKRVFRLLRPSHEHSAFSATLLLMSAVMLSRVIGYVREAYIAWAFGAGPQTDAYVAGFTIPDWLNYIVAGGTASITFVSIYTRFLAQNKEEEAQKTFSVIVTVMTVVLGIGTILAEIFTPQIERHLFSGFSPEQIQLCVHLTRILLPAQIFFYVGGVVSAVLLSRRLFLFPAFGPLLYNVAIILEAFCSPIGWASRRSPMAPWQVRSSGRSWSMRLAPLASALDTVCPSTSATPLFGNGCGFPFHSCWECPW